MKRTLLASAFLLGSAALTPVFAQEAAAAAEDNGPLAAKNFTSTVYLTTNYMFRGISNSDGPAVQGSVDYTWNGLFAGAWASNTEFSDGNFEIDYYGGYRFSQYGLDFTLQGIYYTYPGEDEGASEGFDLGNGRDSDYGELNIGVGKTFAAAPLAPTIGLNYFYSPDTFGEDGDSHTYQGNVGITLPVGVGVYATLGYNETDGDKSTLGYTYLYFQTGANYTLHGFKLDVSYVGTDESDSLKRAYPDIAGDNPSKLIDGKFVFTVSRTF